MVAPMARRMFEEAVVAARQVNDVLALSYAYGYLGELYELTRRPAEALEMTRRALFAAMQAEGRFGHFDAGNAAPVSGNPPPGSGRAGAAPATGRGNAVRGAAGVTAVVGDSLVPLALPDGTPPCGCGTQRRCGRRSPPSG